MQAAATDSATKGSVVETWAPLRALGKECAVRAAAAPVRKN